MTFLSTYWIGGNIILTEVEFRERPLEGLLASLLWFLDCRWSLFILRRKGDQTVRRWTIQ